MVIYTTAFNKVFGKQIPTLQSPRGLGLGPAGNAGRFIRLARWAIKYRKPITGLGAVGIGALTKGATDLDAPYYIESETYQTNRNQFSSYGITGFGKGNSRKARCRCVCSRGSRRRNNCKSSIHRTMDSRRQSTARKFYRYS